MPPVPTALDQIVQHFGHEAVAETPHEVGEAAAIEVEIVGRGARGGLADEQAGRPKAASDTGAGSHLGAHWTAKTVILNS